ncbi:mannose-6-phosphate isomerase-like protein (cupin superfamily) [Actinoalloteichus hoggarensis]|uniref:Cupin domain protein n=1 Tax=Actinoalloteichus hoggarensis TaxID=1470176 RepID=A0A221W7J6_9PSEU|nr:cupin domain-containing protein [Actinoalloteichus hoggarensis]ASO21681.1 Cupin domain protein [Actinoalloteichus hoggarensis]MBB5922275.1 mannose-6-phosphate isomerase-like protein (cupin superfamily) [Actinoalloteichus hoggarensis]
MNGDELVFRDGHSVRFVAQGHDDDGEFLRMEHRWPTSGRLAGPHWHPVLREHFRVVRGRARFRVDGRDHTAGPGDELTILPRQVHEFWSETPDLVLDYVARPPLQHRRMFEFWHELDSRGRTTRAGVPTNPLDLGLLWELQDGYIAGPPAWLQRFLFGGLARLARLLRRNSSRPANDSGVR